MNNIHKEIGIESNMKVVVVRETKFVESDIQSAINAMDYAGKEHLRLRRLTYITGTGTILGNVMILDVNIPLESSNSSDWTRHASAFNQAVEQYFVEGVRHKTTGQTFGDFGELLSLGYFSEKPVKTVTIEVTDDLLSQILSLGGRLV